MNLHYIFLRLHSM